MKQNRSGRRAGCCATRPTTHRSRPDSRSTFSTAWPKTALLARRKCRALFNSERGYPIQSGTDKLAIVAIKGIDSELSPVAFTIANGGLTAGLRVSMFLTSTAIDLVRKGGHSLTHVAPLQTLAAMTHDLQKRGGHLVLSVTCVGHAASMPAARPLRKPGPSKSQPSRLGERDFTLVASGQAAPRQCTDRAASAEVRQGKTR
jgi:predicted peroxiredoxin